MVKKSVNPPAPLLDAFDEKASSGIGERLKAFREALGMSRPVFAAALGRSDRGIQDNELGKSPPGSETIWGCIRLGLDPYWLLTGEGEMLLPKGPAAVGGTIAREGDYIEVPLFDVRVAAGHGAVNDHERQLGSLAFRRDWVRKEISTPLDQLALVYVQGDSMEPELRDGDVVMVDRSVQDATREGIYVLMLNDNLVIKRLQRLPERKVRVSSANPAYQAFVMDDIWDDADHWIVGRAVWSGRRL